MAFNLDKCWRCKYSLDNWCSKRGDIDDPSVCNGCDMNTGDICHCLTVVNADKCERFTPKED